MVALVLAACAFVDADMRQTRIDADGDGVRSASVGGNDCDDANPDVGPPATVYPDADADGYGTGEGGTGCTGVADPGDCDDTDPDVHPGGVETCGGDVDADCDGNIGLCTLEDFGPSIVGAAEGLRAGAAIGGIDPKSGPLNAVLFGAPGAGQSSGAATLFLGEDAADAASGFISAAAGYAFEGSAGGTGFGTSLALFDIDGDSEADLIVGAPTYDSHDGSGGALGIAAGPFDRSGNDMRYITSEAADDELGASVTFADLGDPQRAIVGGAPGADTSCGFAYVVRNNGFESLDVFSAFQTGGSKLFGDCLESPDNRLGTAVVAADLDGDGRDEVIVGAPGDASKETDGVAGGAIWIIPTDALESELALVERLEEGSVVRWASADAAAAAGTAIAVGEFANDGLPDIAVGAPGASAFAARGGLIYFLFNPLTDDVDGDASLSEAGARIEGDVDRAEAGSALTTIPADTSAARDRLAIGAPGEDDAVHGENSGAAYIFTVTEDFNSPALSAADVRLSCAVEDCAAGTALGAGDFDADGLFDLFIGAPGGYDPEGKKPDVAPGTVTIALGAVWSR